MAKLQVLKSLSRLSCCFALLLILKSVVLAQPLGKAKIEEDQRLGVKITLREKQIVLGDLLERLSKQSGVSITINHHESVSGYPLAINCEDVPLSTIMDALYGMFSSKDSLWLWSRTGIPGSFKYTLIQTQRAKERSARIEAYAEQALRKFFAVMFRLAELPMEERIKRRQEIKDVLFVKEDKFIEFLFKGEITWDQFRFISRAMTKKQFDDMLSNGKPIEIQVNELPKEAYNSLYAWSAGTYLNANTNSPAPLPDKITISIARQRGAKKLVSPTFHIQLDRRGSLSFLQTGFFEGFSMREFLWRQWILQGDSRENPNMEKSVADTPSQESVTPPPPAFLQNIPPIRQSPFRETSFTLPTQDLLQARFLELSIGASVPMIALLPYDSIGGLERPIKQTVSTFLGKSRIFPHRPIYKWRNDMLLVNYPQYFVTGDDNIPYKLTKEWKTDKDDIIHLPDLVRFMCQITETQAQKLGIDNSEKFQAARMYRVLTLARTNPEILTAEGMKVDQELVHYLNTLPSFSNQPDFANSNVVSIRLVEGETKIGEHKATNIYAEGITKSGKVVRFSSFVQLPKYARNDPFNSKPPSDNNKPLKDNG